MLFVFYAYRSLLARLRANLVTILAVILFVTGGTMGLAVYLSLEHELVATTPPENILVLAKGAASETGSKLELEAARKIALLDGVKRDGDTPLAARELIANVYVNTTNFGHYEPAVPMRGIDELSLKVHHAKLVEGALPAPGSLEVIVGKKVARKQPNLKVGGELFLPGGTARVVGMFEADGSPLENEVWTWRSALELHTKVKFLSSTTVVADGTSNVSALVDRINTNKDIDAQAITLTEYRESGAGMRTILKVVLVLLILLSVVATSAIATTMSAAVILRLPEFAAMVAIGIRRSVLARMVVIESVVLATAGAIIGALISELVRSQVSTIPLGQTPIELVTLPIIPVVGVLLGVLVGVIGGIGPALVVRRLDVIKTLR